MSVQEILPNEAEAGQQSGKVASGLHGVIGMRLGWQLSAYVYPNNLGWVFNSTTNFAMLGQPSSRQPDVAFVALERLAEPPDEEVPFAPDLAAEVVSKNDTAYEIEKKVIQYQQSGVKLIWVIYPLSKTVAVYRLSSQLTPEILDTRAELDGEQVVRGFKLRVSNLF